MQENHIRFADKYFETLNAKESAIYAGFSVDTAKQMGWKLLQREDIQEYLSAARAEYAKNAGVSKQWVIERMKFVSDACTKAIPVMVFDPELKSMVQMMDDEGNLVYEFDSSGVINSTREIGKLIGAYEADNSQKRTNISLMTNDPLSDGE